VASLRLAVALLVLTVVALAVSYAGRFDTFTWFLEAGPVLAAIPVLVATRRRFPLTRLAYVCICLHALVLIVGAHYTYARVPLGEWARDALDLERNHYDRLGHVAQGFFPAIVAREVLVRTSPLRRGGWLGFLVVCFCLAFSAFYELVEWWVAVASDEGDAVAFLATQGDPWDTQWDMFLALLGATAAVLLLSRAHDRQLAEVRGLSRADSVAARTDTVA